MLVGMLNHIALTEATFLHLKSEFGLLSSLLFFFSPLRACTRVGLAITWLSVASPLLPSVNTSLSICQR